MLDPTVHEAQRLLEQADAYADAGHERQAMLTYAKAAGLLLAAAEDVAGAA